VTLKEFVAERDLRVDAVALLARVDQGTISRIINGKSRPRPETVVRLARGLGVSARRMQAMVDESRDAARPS
jgi:plasmid maintenance system antidote protein VapI